MVTLGIDEVGRGCWAGPLVAGAVILREPILGIKDSKKLNRTKREHYSEVIFSTASATGLGWVQPFEIDTLGLTESVRLAMFRAVQNISVKSDRIIIDGNFNFLSSLPNTVAIIKADELYPEVSAASIIAKVARDNYMIDIAAKYPGYEFERHVGYGTKLHIQKLLQLGVSDIHRLSYKPIQAMMPDGGVING